VIVIRKNNGAFAEHVHGKWWEVGDVVAREKVLASFTHQCTIRNFREENKQHNTSHKTGFVV
jgi:hypothetical protein